MQLVFGDVSSIVSALAAVVGVLAGIAILFPQLREIKRATYAQSFLAVADRLQADDVRHARGAVFALIQTGTDFEEWSKDKDVVGQAEIVCQSYDIAGIVARNHMLPSDMIVDSWGDSLRRLWPALQPLVNRYRETRGNAYWDDFEWLGKEAIKRHGSAGAA